jgi:hypothetical protein
MLTVAGDVAFVTNGKPLARKEVFLFQVKNGGVTAIPGR